MSPSLGTLMLALKAIDAEIGRREELLRTAELTDEQAEDESSYVLDLQKALSELAGLYEDVRGGDTSLPAIDSLLGRPDLT